MTLVQVSFQMIVGAALLFCAAYEPVSRHLDVHEPSSSGGAQPSPDGGNLLVALRSEPKTLNPVLSNDISSREVLGQMTSDLIHINRHTQSSEAALASSWSLSVDGRVFILELRHGLRFSDGEPFDADDVVFSFRVYLDETINASQRSSLVLDGTPMVVEKLGQYTVKFKLKRPYASAERIFDSIAMLPRHLLERPYSEGKLNRAWAPNTPATGIAGLGPFRLKKYVPGQQLILERNPYYWKTDDRGTQLPYLKEITFLFVGNQESEVMRLESGEIDIASRLTSDDYSALLRQRFGSDLQMYDVGPNLDYSFLLLNMNTKLPNDTRRTISDKQRWFNDVRFRQAISSAIDRQALNRIVYEGRGTPIWTHVTPGNKFWFDSSTSRPNRSLSHSRDLLKASGFTWRPFDGSLIDEKGSVVEFSIIVSSSNSERMQMATMIQQDLGDIGIRIQIVPLEFRSMIDRIFQSHDYETAVMGLGGGDVDPNSQMNVWLSSGDDHLWNLGQSYPATRWEAEIDRLMRQQMVATFPAERKRIYDRVQAIEVEQVPVVFLVSPNLLVAATRRVRNFEPAILDSHTLWNSERLYIQDPAEGHN